MNNNQAVNLQTNKRKMHQRFGCFLVVLLLMFTGTIFAQINSGSNSYPHIKNERKIFSLTDSLLPIHLFSIRMIRKKFPPEPFEYCYCWADPVAPPTTPVFDFLTPVAKDFSTTQLGIVCKKELQFEKKTSIPLRLRLGSLDYTNYLEQKPNSLKPF